MSRVTLGYVVGRSGRFDRDPFYRLSLPADASRELDRLLAKANGGARRTATLTATYEEPDRLRVTEAEAPAYEHRAAAQYVRGDVLRVQGRQGVSCGLDMSARFGVPLIREQLRLALSRCREYVEMRVPSRVHDVVEFVPDVDLIPSEENSLVSGSTAAATAVLPAEDFSDWETQRREK